MSLWLRGARGATGPARRDDKWQMTDDKMDESRKLKDEAWVGDAVLAL
jgi:hypothetical protein